MCTIVKDPYTWPQWTDTWILWRSLWTLFWEVRIHCCWKHFYAARANQLHDSWPTSLTHHLLLILLAVTFYLHLLFLLFFVPHLAACMLITPPVFMIREWVVWILFLPKGVVMELLLKTTSVVVATDRQEMYACTAHALTSTAAHTPLVFYQHWEFASDLISWHYAVMAVILNTTVFQLHHMLPLASMLASWCIVILSLDHLLNARTHTHTRALHATIHYVLMTIWSSLLSIISRSELQRLTNSLHKVHADKVVCTLLGTNQ